MRTILILASAALTTSAILAGPASAGDSLHLTPPLYREQARATTQVHSVSDLTTTPHPVSATRTVSRPVATLERPMVQASADTNR
ncbi:hypothetical protein [Methylobacterium pseudosasicola]|uniref:Uncharacterized protein n=1 Tax=Methylobacterium pseudosasicola TaxID=582667 RepID=A0A1I4NE75_9HYPH|nr:hypothetical protein [Methylobacterium pseudosasicola]SFM13686.1 hypothetical protein SAMN05192568_102081 [Methylobacterium pseudosasicola]